MGYALFRLMCLRIELSMSVAGHQDEPATIRGSLNIYKVVESTPTILSPIQQHGP